MNKRWTIYCHTHVATGRRYVGLTSKTMMARWNGHVNLAKRSNGRRSHFAAAIKKYGPAAFSHEVLEVCHDLEVANLAEECWIELFDARNPEKGFNLMKGGKNVPHPIRKNPWDDPEFRAKQLAAASSEEYRLNQSRASTIAMRKQWDDNHEKWSKSNRMTAKDPIVRKKISDSHAGVPLSQAHKDAISKSRAGKKTSQETKAKLRGITLNRAPEEILRISRSLRDKLRNGDVQNELIRLGITHKVCKRHGRIPMDQCYCKIARRTGRKPRLSVECSVCVRERTQARSMPVNS